MRTVSDSTFPQLGPDMIPNGTIDRLWAYPYFVHLPRLLDNDDPSQLRGALSALHGSADVCFTRISVDAAAVGRVGLATQLSRTHRAMPLHTDSSYEVRPHDLIAFQMVRSDSDGGETVLAPVDEAIVLLGEETLTTLRRPIFPFGKINRAVLDGRDQETRIRYYRRQILPGLDPLRHKSMVCTKAMDSLDRALASVGERYRLRLGAGDVLILNNHKVLHGRTALPVSSARLVYRFRKHLDV